MNDLSGILTQVYSAVKRGSAITMQIHELETAYYNAVLLSGRFDFHNAVDMLVRCLSLLEAMPLSKEVLKLRAQSLVELGNIRRDQGDIIGERGAFNLYLEARTIWKELGDSYEIALTTWFLGACYEMRGNYFNALKMYNEVLEMIFGIDGLSVLRGRVTLRIGTVLTKLKELDEAKKMIDAGILLLEGRVPSSDLAYAKQKSAIIQMERGNKEHAIEAVEQSILMIPKTDLFRLTQAKILMADLQFSAGLEDTAIITSKEARLLAVEYGFSHQLSSLSLILSKYVNISITSDYSKAVTSILLEEPIVKIVQDMLYDYPIEMFKQLCSDLKIDYDRLTGETKLRKIQSLISRFQLMNKMNLLVDIARRKMFPTIEIP